MHSKEYKSMSSAMQEIMNKSWKELRENELKKESDTVTGDVAGKPMPFLKKDTDTDKFEKELNTNLNEFLESTAEYAKSLEKIAKDRALKRLTKKDKATLIKIANLLKMRCLLKTYSILYE